MEEHIQFDFLFDNHFNELKAQELMLARINLVTQMDPFVGKYFSTEYLRREVLQQTDKEFKEIDKQIKQDIDTGMALNPVDVNTFDMMDRQNMAFEPEIATQQQQDQAAIDKAQSDDEHKKELQKIKATPKPKVASSTK